jgi:thymidylate kinase
MLLSFWVLDEGDEKQKRLREVMFNPDFRFDTNAEIFLFWADKLQMLVKIKKAINSGKNVLVNRWELSQYAYQIYGKQREDLRDITEKVGAFIESDIKPDLYILFDISPQESQKRKRVRTGETGKFEDYYDNAETDFFVRAINGYKTEIAKYPHVIINGEQSKVKVFQDVLGAVTSLF